MSAHIRSPTSVSHPPLPPAEFAARVGHGEDVDPLSAFEAEGRAVRERIANLLPREWDFAGKRVLDFGCGAGRVLRTFLPEANRAEFWGCDIHGASVDWINANLNPPLHAFRNAPAPPLKVDDQSFDLVYATSVFTHIGRLWSEWLLEMHRVLSPGGILIASFLGEGVWPRFVGEAYDEDKIGMTVRRHWSAEHTDVFHSEWWLREHWGRAFDIYAVMRPAPDQAGVPQATHSYVAATRGVAVSAAELERCDPSEPRELAGVQTNVRLLEQELAEMAEGQAPRAYLRSLLRRAVLASPVEGPVRSLHRRCRRHRRGPA